MQRKKKIHSSFRLLHERIPKKFMEEKDYIASAPQYSYQNEPSLSELQYQ